MIASRCDSVRSRSEDQRWTVEPDLDGSVILNFQVAGISLRCSLSPAEACRLGRRLSTEAVRVTPTLATPPEAPDDFDLETVFFRNLGANCYAYDQPVGMYEVARPGETPGEFKRRMAEYLEGESEHGDSLTLYLTQGRILTLEKTDFGIVECE